MDKLKLIWNLARSNSYVVITDKVSVIAIPMLNPNKIKDYVILASQTVSLQEFYGRLGEVVKDHEKKVKLMQARKGSNLYSKGKVETSKRKK